MTFDENVKRLVQYGIESGLVPEEERIYTTNQLLELFEQVNAAEQTILMVTHSVKAASHAGRVLFLRDGEVYHQLYRGSESRESQFRRISDTLTVLTQGGESHA